MKAVYENGVFRPLEPVTGLREREEVDLRLGGRLPELILSEERAAPFDLPRHGEGQRVSARTGSFRLPNAPELENPGQDDV